MTLMDELTDKWIHKLNPALIVDGEQIWFENIKNAPREHLSEVNAGDVVAIVGDFNAQSIADLINLIDLGAILVPLSPLTFEDHEYFFETAKVNWVVRDCKSERVSLQIHNELLQTLRSANHPGLVLFSSGTTGRPKAVLHDLSLFLERFKTPRPTLRTLAFLLFDHIGGINTLFHTLFNSGTILCTTKRDVHNVLQLCKDFEIEVLPTTPTFLRLMLISGALQGEMIPESLKIITYGTERMDEGTLKLLCDLLPRVDFRQTFGMSELGILRVKSKARDSLFMKIGGEGIEWRVVNNLLEIRSESRMLGYLNSPSPFDKDGWYQTNDLVEVDGEYIKVVGRNNDVVNVGGLKFLLSEVERVAYAHPSISLATAVVKSNPITGQHVEINVQLVNASDSNEDSLKEYFRLSLPNHMRPRRIHFAKVHVGHRHKKL